KEPAYKKSVTSVASYTMASGVSFGCFTIYVTGVFMRHMVAVVIAYYVAKVAVAHCGCGTLWLLAIIAVASDIMKMVISFTVASIWTVVQCYVVASCLAACYVAVYYVVAFNLQFSVKK
ncbi:16757_t:CDS:2, partial [Acaulospora morrowiae]